jgi:hypothetical protein
MTAPVLVGGNPTALSWRCRYYFTNLGIYHVGPFWDYGIDMNQACRWQYGARAYASTNNVRNPYSWRCNG